MTPDNATIALQLLTELEPTELFGAYSGKQGCACGCRGKHYKRGESKNDDRQTARIWAAMRVAAEGGAKVSYMAGDHIAVDAPNNRLLVAYFPGCFSSQVGK
jgi:hypothetical protein